jgi:hypothetical protein
MSEARKLTQEELLTEARARFGDNPLDWAFRCPHCGDVATGNDFSEALAKHPRKNRDGSATMTSDIIGQECIGRTLGALKGPAGTSGGRGEAPRGCDWCAYGLFPGPWEIVLPGGRSMHAFPLADAAARRGGES